MTMHMSARVTATIILEDDDRFDYLTPTGKCLVRQIYVFNLESGTAQISGRTYKADGTLGLFDRKAQALISDLPGSLQGAIAEIARQHRLDG